MTLMAKAPGYSGTPLAKKLGIKEGSSVVVQGAPMDYAMLLAPLPDDVAISTRLKRAADIFHIFVQERAALLKALHAVLKVMEPHAAIWVSWPKKASKVKTDITEDVVREIALPLGLVDVKVCAVDDVWSGLKIVIRKSKRA